MGFQPYARGCTLNGVKLSAFRGFDDGQSAVCRQVILIGRQIVCGGQFKRAQGVFFNGEYFRLAFGGTFNAFDKFAVDFRHADVGKDDVDFVDAEPLQCWRSW